MRVSSRDTIKKNLPGCSVADHLSGRKIPADLYFKLSKAAFGAILRPCILRGCGSTPFNPDPAESGSFEESQTGDVVREYVAPQLPQPEYRAGILFEQSQCLCPVSFPALCRIVNQNADACPFVLRLEIEQVDGSDRFPRCVVDHQPQLSASVNTSLLLLDELFDRIARERFDRTADCPQRRIVFPPA